VLEDPAGLDYETDLHLRHVGQHAASRAKSGTTNSAQWRTRTFAFDSLFAMWLCANNPEIWYDGLFPFLTMVLQLLETVSLLVRLR